ncbi:oxidoreductase, partial [Mycolicibacterium mucogenicum]|nr:oxidoreductase [Mycolicibacterium mucogenicum]
MAAARKIADGVIALDLTDPRGEMLPAWEPGAHVDLRLPSGLVRQYSLCGDPATRRSYQLAISHVDGGDGSQVDGGD